MQGILIKFNQMTASARNVKERAVLRLYRDGIRAAEKDPGKSGRRIGPNPDKFWKILAYT